MDDFRSGDYEVADRADKLYIVGTVVKALAVVVGFVLVLASLASSPQPHREPDPGALGGFLAAVLVGGTLFIQGMVICGLSDLIRTSLKSSENTRVLLQIKELLAAANPPAPLAPPVITATRSVLDTADGTRRVSAFRRYSDLPETAVGSLPDDPGEPIRLGPIDGATDENKETLTFACPWCGRDHTCPDALGSIVFRCVACGNQVLATVGR